jgi:hypothetical protein
MIVRKLVLKPHLTISFIHEVVQVVNTDRSTEKRLHAGGDAGECR